MNVLFLLAFRYLNGRKLRSFLTTLAVIFGVMVIFGMNILLPAFTQAFQATLMAASNAVDLTISQRSGEAFSAAVLDTLRGVEGVRVAQGMLSRPLNLPADFFDHDPNRPDRVSEVLLVGVDLATAQEMRNYTVQAGRFLRPTDGAACVITQSLADNLALGVGDLLPLPTTQGVVRLAVTGILPPRTTPGSEEVLVTLSEAQRLLDAPGKVDVLEANFATGDETRRDSIRSEIVNRLGAGYTFGGLSSNSDLYANLQLAQVLFNAFGFLSLFMGGFIIFNTFRTLVAERRRDIGMLRAVGANRRMVTGLFLIEGLIQGGVGTLLGMLLGYAFGALALAGVSSILQQFIHIRPGAPVITPGVVILAVAAGVGITLAAGLLPALSAGRLQPVEALRPAVAGVENRRAMGLGALAGVALMVAAGLLLLLGSGAQPVGGGAQPVGSGPQPIGSGAQLSVGAFVFLIGLVLLAPALVRPITGWMGRLFALWMARQGTGMLAQGSLTRQPTRAAVTASTTMIALAILVVVGGMTTSVSQGFLHALKVSLGSDYLFVPPSIGVWNTNVGASSHFTEQMRAIPGVGPVSTFRFAKATTELRPAAPVKGQPPAAALQSGAAQQGMTVSLLGIDPVAYPQVGGLEFTQGSPAQAYQALARAGGMERAMIVNGVFAASAGLKPGDSVPLITLNGRQDYRVVAIGTDYLNAKVVTAYISQANLAADFGKTEDIFIQLNLAPGADRAAVEARLKTLRQQYPQFVMISGQLYLQQATDLLNTAFAGLYVLFAFLAVPSLIAMLNTLAIGVIERTREIGMIRAVGATKKQVGGMILAEALLLAGLGTLFGLLAGLYLDYAMLSAFATGGFPARFFFPWAGLLFATLIGLLFGALAAILPARRAAGLEIVKALRYE